MDTAETEANISFHIALRVSLHGNRQMMGWGAASVPWCFPCRDVNLSSSLHQVSSLNPPPLPSGCHLRYYCLRHHFFIVFLQITLLKTGTDFLFNHNLSTANTSLCRRFFLSHSKTEKFHCSTRNISLRKRFKSIKTDMGYLTEPISFRAAIYLLTVYLERNNNSEPLRWICFQKWGIHIQAGAVFFWKEPKSPRTKRQLGEMQWQNFNDMSTQHTQSLCACVCVRQAGRRREQKRENGKSSAVKILFFSSPSLP